VAHGVIFNAIMTGEFWHAAAAARLSAVPAFVVTAASGVGYVLLNGLLLFDYGNTMVGLAAPLLALCLVWAGCSFTRILIETSERAKLTQRFSQYVDPTLVNYVIERPDQVRLEGETRELTVVFTDLVAFTALTERLGERSVTLLNEYMGRIGPDHPPTRRLREQVPRRRDHVLLRRAGAPPEPLEAAKAMETIGPESMHHALPRAGRIPTRVGTERAGRPIDRRYREVVGDRGSRPEAASGPKSVSAGPVVETHHTPSSCARGVEKVTK
jgi:hypothetical protein